MWGGLKARTAYGEIFRRWSATKPIEEVRQQLFKEPRPWHLLFSLHEHRHFLSDHHCSRLLSWCATTIQLARSVEEKEHAYRLTQESFNVLLHSHGVANLSFLEYMRICAAGNDITAAYRLYRYWLESSRPEAGCLLHLSWLAQLGLITPSTEKAEDMGLAVMEQYMTHHYHPQSHSALSCSSTAGEGGTSTPEHNRKTLFACLKGLQSRVQNPVLLEFIDKLPLSEEEARTHLKLHGWPHQAHHHTFPNLEGGVPPSVVSVDFPALRDSILHPVLIQRLESAAFAEKNVEKVITLLQYFQQRIRNEKSLKEMTGSNSPPRAAASREPDIWRQLHDASAVQFRKKIIDAGGLTPELYHYVVVALSSTKPSAALRTMQRMQAAKLRVLDLTRAVLIIATSGSLKDQVQLFSDQMREISFREQLDLDHDTNTHLEAFWKFDYTTFFHYQNALNKKAFLLFLINGLGPVAVQRIWRSYLMQEDKDAILDGNDEKEWNMDLVILEPSFREAVVQYMESQYGDSHVQKCLDDITHFIPKLDISLIGSFPHFEAYAVPQQAMEDIATDMRALRQKLSSFTCIYLVDTSFVETSEEGIFRLGRREQAGCAHSVWNEKVRQPSTSTTETAPQPQERSLILFPYRVLQQLANTVTEASSAASVSLDPAMREDIQEEVLLASQRLRAVSSMIHQSHSAAVSAVPEGEKDREPQHPAEKISNPMSSNSTGSGSILAPSSSVNASASASDEMKLAEDKKRSTALPSVSVRVLHLTECLLSQVVELKALKSTFDLHPDQSENDRLLLIVSLIRTAAPPNCRVVLCSDDVELNIKLEDLAQNHPPGVVQQLFPARVELLSTPIPDHVVNEEKSILVDDNPVLDLDLEDFTPHLHAPPPAPAAEADDVTAADAAAVVDFPSTAKPKDNSGEAKLFSEGSVMVAANHGGGGADFSDSPWLRLLEEDGDPPIEKSQEGLGGMIVSANHDSESMSCAEGHTTHTEGEDRLLHGSRNASNESNTSNNPYNADKDEALPSLTTTASLSSPTSVPTTGARRSPLSAPNGEEGGADRVDGDALLTTYASPHDVTPIAAHVVQASTVKSVFHEFDVLEPEEVWEREVARAARRTQLSPDGDSRGGGEKGPSARSFSVLMKDTLSHRGYSRRLRARMARRLSNQSGGRVPFNLRYQVVEANVHDPRNRHLLDIYRRGVERKREEFHRKWGE